MECQPDPASVWQMKLVLTLYRIAFPRISRGMLRKVCLVVQRYRFYMLKPLPLFLSKTDPLLPEYIFCIFFVFYLHCIDWMDAKGLSIIECRRRL